MPTRRPLTQSSACVTRRRLWHRRTGTVKELLLKTEVTTCAMHSMLLYCHPGDVLRAATWRAC